MSDVHQRPSCSVHHMMHQAQAWLNVIETGDGAGKTLGDLDMRLSVRT